MFHFFNGRKVPAICIVMVIVLAGCTSSGLSPREVRGQDFSTYVYGLYALPEPTAVQPARPLRVPARIAVAQVGEVAPPIEVLDRLRTDPTVIASVQPVPGIMDVSEIGYRGTPAEYQVQARRAAQAHLERMRRYAHDIGAEYLFLYGGTIDRATTNTSLSLMDLTLVGAFVVPSKRIEGVARASGALIDVSSGRVVLSVSASQDASRMSPTFARENGELRLVKALRDEVVIELAEQLTERMKSQAALGG